MINFEKILSKLITEAPVGSKRERLLRAIKSRNPVSFYYNGPREEVLAGRRIKSELVAMGVTKKGNLVVRGWVQPPSVSKKGFGDHGWRLFILDRISGIQIYEDETFDTKRPGLNQDGDKSLDVVYATSDWGVIQKPEKPKPQPTPTREPEPQTAQPKAEPELPQPKPEDKPSATPQPEINFASQVYDELKTKVQDIDGQKQLSPNDFSVALDSLRKRKISDWSNRQREIGKNTTPGEGTRRRIEKDAEIELYNELKKDNVVVAQTPLQESISRIKTLIFF
jgi:hypothetical protein